MRQRLGTTYDERFFAGQSKAVRASAARVVPLVLRALGPHSAVDVGCGLGEWLAELQVAGVPDVLGLDGDHVVREQLEIPDHAFRAVDLTLPLRLDRRFDLAISLEVAEHLPPERGDSFVADLVALAPAVLFSAAIPGQPGTHHINTRWQDEWAAIFADFGYEPVDLVRPLVWDDPGVYPWYAQNTLLYTSKPLTGESRPGLPLRVVHPSIYSQEPTLKSLIAELAPALKRAVRYQASRRSG
jgi:SAM-dependent methyltransferase